MKNIGSRMIEERSGLTAPDPKKKLVHEMLRQVDALIRSRDLAKAFLEIQRARALDERNPYIQAYEERLTELIEAKKKDDRDQEQRNADARRRHEREQREIMEQQARQQYMSKAAAPTSSPSAMMPPAPYTDYVTASSPQKVHSMINNRAPRQAAARRQIVVVVDDDKDLLPVLKEVITLHGYDCTAFETTDEAFAQLRSGPVPDIIICDINLETSTMGGFGFYERIRTIGRLSSVPFVFLSGLSDEAVIRTGKELGADDYLTKPISEEMLISTIKGKLRRFERLQQRDA